MTAESRVDQETDLLVYPVDKGSGATTSLAEADGVVSVDADTDYLEAGEAVDVQLFSPDVRPPTLLGVGEDDPTLNQLLDRLERPRYLSVGSRPALRQLREASPTSPSSPDRSTAKSTPKRSAAGTASGDWSSGPATRGNRRAGRLDR